MPITEMLRTKPEFYRPSICSITYGLLPCKNMRLICELRESSEVLVFWYSDVYCEHVSLNKLKCMKSLKVKLG